MGLTVTYRLSKKRILIMVLLKAIGYIKKNFNKNKYNINVE